MSETKLNLTNSDFEGGWREVDGVGELKVADGWHPWWHQSDRRPEFKIARLEVDPSRIHGGQGAQQWFTSYATHTGGIYQQVHDVPVGRTLVLSAYVQAFSRNDDTNWRQSDGRYRMRIGIDPYGGLDPESRDIVWSEAVQPYDSWTELRIETQGRSDRCTVYVWGQAEWPVKHNNGYVDDCSLVYLGEPETPPPPPPPPAPADLAHLAAAVRNFARAVSAAADELARQVEDLADPPAE